MAPPDFPTPIGVFRSVEDETLENRIWRQMEQAKEKAGGEPDIEKLLHRAETWTVN